MTPSPTPTGGPSIIEQMPHSPVFWLAVVGIIAVWLLIRRSER